MTSKGNADVNVNVNLHVYLNICKTGYKHDIHMYASRKHAYIILTPLNPIFI